MGLINEYGPRLVGKVFIFQGWNQPDGSIASATPKPVWCIGRIVKVSRLSFVTYKPLARSKNLKASPDSFNMDSPIDQESKLIKGSRRFEKYLELFNGTNR